MIKENKNEQFPVVLGFDWADEKHDFCLWDAERDTLEIGVLEHCPEALNERLLNLRDRYPGKSIAVGLEQSKGALAYLLMEHDFLTIYIVNPSTVASMRDAWKPSGAKDDPTDAEPSGQESSGLSHEALEILEQRRVHPAVHLFPMLLADDDPGVPKLLEVVGDGGEGKVEILGDLADRAVDAVLRHLAAAGTALA